MNLGLVKYGFRVWDEAGTRSTRDRVRQTLTNAAGTRICSDDVVRLFLLWLKTYDDLHMRVVRVIHKNPGATRAFMWEQIHGEEVREDSAEADLFKLNDSRSEYGRGDSSASRDNDGWPFPSETSNDPPSQEDHLGVRVRRQQTIRAYSIGNSIRPLRDDRACSQNRIWI